MEEKLDLLSIGDATLDTFVSPTETEALCNIDTKECLICFSYGDKIPLKQLDHSVGGNAANNAVGATRLGIKVGLVSTLGDDETGRQTLDYLKKEAVDTNYVTVQPDSSSNYSIVINYSGERTIFTYRPEREYAFPEELPRTQWVYLTSMAEPFEAFYSRTVDWIKSDGGVKLAFNPGSRQIRAGTEVLRSALEATYVVYVNREEAEYLTEFRDSLGKERELLTTLTSLGPKMAIITDGGNGAYVFDGERYYHSEVLPVDAVERTGAGDAFGSGCLAALIKGKDIKEALLWGTVNAASVIGYVGSQKGLLKEDELNAWLARAASCEVGVDEL